MTSLSLMAMEIRTGDPQASWEVGQVLVLELLRLHGADLEEALAAFQACRKEPARDPLILEVFGEVDGDPERCAFGMRVTNGETDGPCSLGPGRSRPLP